MLLWHNVRHSAYATGQNTTAHEFEVAEVVALVLLLNAVLGQSIT